MQQCCRTPRTQSGDYGNIFTKLNSQRTGYLAVKATKKSARRVRNPGFNLRLISTRVKLRFLQLRNKDCNSTPSHLRHLHELARRAAAAPHNRPALDAVHELERHERGVHALERGAHLRVALHRVRGLLHGRDPQVVPVAALDAQAQHTQRGGRDAAEQVEQRGRRERGVVHAERAQRGEARVHGREERRRDFAIDAEGERVERGREQAQRAQEAVRLRGGGELDGVHAPRRRGEERGEVARPAVEFEVREEVLGEGRGDAPARDLREDQSCKWATPGDDGYDLGRGGREALQMTRGKKYGNERREDGVGIVVFEGLLAMSVRSLGQDSNVWKFAQAVKDRVYDDVCRDVFVLRRWGVNPALAHRRRNVWRQEKFETLLRAAAVLIRLEAAQREGRRERMRAYFGEEQRLRELPKGEAGERQGLEVPRRGEVAEDMEPYLGGDSEQLRRGYAATSAWDPLEALSSPVNDLDKVVLHNGAHRDAL
ncbi:hypothetical protein GGX14DRAFT_543937 [Mycena pura]|uniref:Uncharacterized protein n=1 Tax=Mycena pura TaxID=153505 RepID=A0AAD6VBN2_9AGAR|nr:hypothetical protein GGX14DRAFT_543937 [Mycena pura]